MINENKNSRFGKISKNIKKKLLKERREKKEGICKKKNMKL